eukprot:gene7741-9071_t
MSNYDDENMDAAGPENGKTDAQYKQEIQARSNEITKALNAGNPASCIALALQDPPIYTKSQAIKDQNATIVINLLGSIKEKDVDACLNNLTADDLDVLMKYIYRGLATGDNSAIFFKWFEATLKKGGIGSVVRAISERKTV